MASSEGRDGKPILCLDFDGVIHRYDSGWQGATTISDDVTDGFFEWLDDAAQHFRIVIYSSRSSDPEAIKAMQFWLSAQRQKWRFHGGISPITDGRPVEIEFADKKPAAFLTIDDRAVMFTGRWADFPAIALREFKPWNKRGARQ